MLEGTARAPADLEAAAMEEMHAEVRQWFDTLCAICAEFAETI